jgi:hypothetical protein
LIVKKSVALVRYSNEYAIAALALQLLSTNNGISPPANGGLWWFGKLSAPS